MINIKLVKQKEYIYIYQQKQVDNIAFGIVEENNERIPIYNKNIDKDVMICDGYQDNGWLIFVEINNDLLTINASISKEDCIKIAENIEYY